MPSLHGQPAQFGRMWRQPSADRAPGASESASPAKLRDNGFAMRRRLTAAALAF